MTNINENYEIQQEFIDKENSMLNQETEVFVLWNGNEIVDVILNNEELAINTAKFDNEIHSESWLKTNILKFNVECVLNENGFNEVDMILRNGKPYKVYVNNIKGMVYDFLKLHNDSYNTYDTFGDYFEVEKKEAPKKVRIISPENDCVNAEDLFGSDTGVLMGVSKIYDGITHSLVKFDTESQNEEFVPVQYIELV